MFSLAYRGAFFLFVLAVSGCARTTQANLPTEQVSYRPAVQPAAEFTTLYERSSAMHDSCLRWQAAHDKLVAAIAHSHLAFLDAHRRTLASLAALEQYYPACQQKLQTYGKRYENLAQQMDIGAAERLLIYRYTTLREEIVQTLEPADDNPSGYADGRPAKR